MNEALPPRVALWAGEARSDRHKVHVMAKIPNLVSRVKVNISVVISSTHVLPLVCVSMVSLIPVITPLSVCIVQSPPQADIS